MAQKNDEEVIRRAPLFTALDDASAATLRESMTQVKVSKGQTLFKEGDAGDRLFVVVDGKLVLTIRERIITWQTIRLDRNDRLNSSDHTQITDYPGDKEAWSIYRQQLRDIPQTFTNPEEVVWPESPNN